MTGNSLFCPLFSLFLIFCVISAGCSEESPSDETAAPTPAHPDAKYREGDIVASSSMATSTVQYIILKYDPAADEYTRALIEQNDDGSWGYRPSNRTEKSARAVLEKQYTFKVGHAAVSSVPAGTLATQPEPSLIVSGKAPAIAKVSPVFAARDTVVSVTITGTNFQDGVTIKLVKAGAAPITASVVSVTPSSISCFFNLNGKSDGSYNLMVINPDGQSDTEQGIFSIGEAPPVIAGIYPVTAALKDKISLTISGQNFRNDVKVSFTRGTAELVCDEPLSLDSTRISCVLDLAASRGASAGDWSVTVLNIRDQQKGTWVKKFMVTNATS